MERMYKKADLDVALCSYDFQTLQTLGNYLLEYGGFEQCAAFRSGSELLQELAEHRHFDALILDEQLQDMDALEMANRLCRLKLDPRPVTVVLSERTFLKRLDRALPQGVDLCFLKPIQAGALAHRIQGFHSGGNEAVHVLCGKLCEAFGVQEETTNCLYLADAELLAWQADTKLAIRKEILLPVSEAHGVSLASVDSGLRRLIDHMEQIDTPAYQEFKQKAGLKGEKPAIGQLLYGIKRYETAKKERAQAL